MKFSFTNKEDYQKQRQALLNEAEKLLNDENIEDSNKKMDEVKEMDEAFENFAKAQANFNALNGFKPSAYPFANGKVIDSMNNANQHEDKFDGMEYRKAFMNYVLKGTELPEQFMNVDQNTKTSDVGVAIPTTILDRIIQKMESTGMILPLVTRTGYKGGLTIPTSTVKPTATWVTEGAGSDKQKQSASGTITFAYHKLRCAVSVSLEVDTMAISAFETMLVNNVSEAMLKAVEQAIISGDGSGKPKGILTETPVTGQTVELTEGKSPTYADLCEAEAKLPLAYENGAVWFMTKTTFMKFYGMTDEQGQPIARVNYGINGRPERTLLGRSVVLNEYMSSYADTVTADTNIAFLFRPEDYVLNTNLNVTIKQYEDNDTDDMITKAVMLVDGKVVDKNSLVVMKIKNS